jgi:hypothetical protein
VYGKTVPLLVDEFMSAENEIQEAEHNREALRQTFDEAAELYDRARPE